MRYYLDTLETTTNLSSISLRPSWDAVQCAYSPSNLASYELRRGRLQNSAAATIAIEREYRCSKGVKDTPTKQLLNGTIIKDNLEKLAILTQLLSWALVYKNKAAIDVSVPFEDRSEREDSNKLEEKFHFVSHIFNYISQQRFLAFFPRV